MPSQQDGHSQTTVPVSLSLRQRDPGTVSSLVEVAAHNRKLSAACITNYDHSDKKQRKKDRQETVFSVQCLPFREQKTEECVKRHHRTVTGKSQNGGRPEEMNRKEREKARKWEDKVKENLRLW